MLDVSNEANLKVSKTAGSIAEIAGQVAMTAANVSAVAANVSGAASQTSFFSGLALGAFNFFGGLLGNYLAKQRQKELAQAICKIRNLKQTILTVAEFNQYLEAPFQLQYSGTISILIKNNGSFQLVIS